MIAHATAALTLLFAQAGAAPDRPCLTPDELGDVVVMALPEVIDSFARTCRTHLPETAFLRSGAAGFAQRLRTEGAVRQENALAAMKRMAPPHLRDRIGSEAGLKVVAGMLTGVMGARLNQKTCREISRFTESLSPLPARNVAMMFSAAAGFGMVMQPPREGAGGPPICAS